MEHTAFGPTTTTEFDNYSRTKGITAMLKKLSITALIAGAAVVTAINGGASASVGDPIEVFVDQVQADEELRDLYRNFDIGPGDPCDITGCPQEEEESGDIKVRAAPDLASLYRNFTVGAGDDNDKPSTRVANADYSNFVIGPGDPCDITGCPQEEEQSGGSKVHAATSLASLYRNFTVGAGDDNDKPSTRVANADYSNFIIGPGDPRDEG